MSVVDDDVQLTDLTVVIPVRNAERLLPACMESAVREKPRAIIVVDGESTDRTVEIAREHGAIVVSDEGQGLPVARQLGAEMAATPRCRPACSAPAGPGTGAAPWHSITSGDGARTGSAWSPPSSSGTR